jgi:sugar lactone lactonase YvrE
MSFMIVSRFLICACILIAALGCAKPPADASQPVRILANGASISGANGMGFGPDGSLYVASVFGSELVVLNPETGEIKRRITEGVKNPDDIAFSSDGSFYWTSILSGEVTGMRSDGSLVVAARLTPGTNPITFSSDDRLFVSQCFFDDKLYEIDPLGVEKPRLLSDRLGPHCGLNGMDWGPDNRLYGPRWFRGEVVSFDVDTLEMRTEATDFEVPAAVKFDSRGRLHVLDTAAGTVVRVEGDERKIIAQFQPGLDNLAFDQSDHLFVSSFIDGSVTRVDADGSHTQIAPSGMAMPGGLALRNGERGPEVVVADFQSIHGYDATSGESTFVNRNVFSVGEMGSVTNIAADGANLILTSWLDGTVKIWDPANQKVIESHSGLIGPVSAIRYAGRIFVAEHGQGRIIALNAKGNRKSETIMSGMHAPTGLAVKNGGLFVTDRITGKLMRVAQNGSPIPVDVIASGLSSPEGLAATKQGFVIVEGDTGRVVGVNALGETRTITTLPAGTAAPTKQQPPSMIFNGIAVSPDGVMFATGEADRVLYRIDRR